MLTATHSGFWRWLYPVQSETQTRPVRARRPGPIFIHDAVHPWKGSTMLLEIMRTDDRVDETPET